jgi:hypothetical protein
MGAEKVTGLLAGLAEAKEGGQAPTQKLKQLPKTARKTWKAQIAAKLSPRTSI